MILIGAFLLLLLSFYFIAKVCDKYFVESLEVITARLKISDDVAGATFMAVGSSAPELFIAIMALSKIGSESIGPGTIVGSAIFNILVIVGAAAIVSTTKLKRAPVFRDLLFYLFSLIILLLTFWDGIITFYEVILYLALYLLYIFILYSWKKWMPETESIIDRMTETPLIEQKQEIEKELEKGSSIFNKFDNFFDKKIAIFFPNLNKNENLYPLTFIISIFFIALLSWVMVDISIFLAHGIGIPEVIIGLTVLAIGTSIPDLISSIIASKKGYGNMAVSNAIGSNTFDILIGLGLPWLIYVWWKGENVVVSSENIQSSIILLFGTVLLLASILIGKKFEITKKEGFLLIFIYILYLAFAISLALYPGWTSSM